MALLWSLIITDVSNLWPFCSLLHGMDGSVALPWGFTITDVSDLWPFCFVPHGVLVEYLLTLRSRSGSRVAVSFMCSKKIREHCPRSPQAGNFFPNIWIG